MSFQAGNTYKFANVKGGTYVDLSGGDNRSIIGYEYHGGANQQWTLEDAGDGKFAIRNGEGKYLSFEGEAGNGVPIVGGDYQQKWEIRQDERNQEHLRIFVEGTNFNLDLADHGNPTPGTLVQLWEETPGKGQTWEFQEA